MGFCVNIPLTILLSFNWHAQIILIMNIFNLLMKSKIRNLPIPVDKRSITANIIQSTTCKPPDSIAPFAKYFAEYGSKSF